MHCDNNSVKRKPQKKQLQQLQWMPMPLRSEGNVFVVDVSLVHPFTLTIHYYCVCVIIGTNKVSVVD
jgi:hypothetical protein